MIQRVRKTIQGDLCATEELSRNSYGCVHASLFSEADDEVTLKLGHFYLSNGETNFKRPLTARHRVMRLCSAEISKLINLLERGYGPLKVKAEQYIKVEDADDAVFFQALRSKFTGKNVSAIVQLLEENQLLPEHIVGGVVHRDRMKAVEQFEAMLGEALNERDHWQPWFKRNDWVLGTSHVVVLGERAIDVKHSSDYLMESEDGFIDVVEIKRPGLQFWMAEVDDHKNWVPHMDLVKAITQANNYLFQLEKQVNSIEDLRRYGCPIARPRALLIYGRSDNWSSEHFEAQRLLNSSMAGIQVLTYDQVLNRARRALTMRVQ